MRHPLRIKYWPNKENRTVELEIVIEGVTLSVEMDIEQARESHEDFGDAVRIVEEDWIIR